MMRASHTTRAYITNAHGLKGFLTCGVIRALKELERSEKNLLEVTKYQDVTIESVLSSL